MAIFALAGSASIPIHQLARPLNIGKTLVPEISVIQVGVVPTRITSYNVCYTKLLRTVAHAHGELGWRCLILDNDIEVGVEGSDLIDLGELV